MSMASTADTQEACRHVLGYHGYEGGYPPGGFTTQLIELWAKADMNNQARLAVAFPAMGYAIRLLQRGEIEKLKDVALDGVIR